ncbi:MAG TPA: transglycosylase SLT domain-containing protein [Rhodothermia bacterium]|nr:transglycosylase SLT domain-containing protein [Rhodothermia bacterium]
MRIQAPTLSRVFIVVIALALVAMPSVASAVSWIPVVPCGTSPTDICTPCHLLQTGKNIIDLVLFGITGPIAAFMVVFAGGQMLLGGGNPAMFGRGKLLLKNTLIGVSIILVAWAATNFIIKGLGGGTSGTPWYEFTCPSGLAAISKIDTQFAPVGAPPTLPQPTGLPQPGVGRTCPDSNLDLCATAADLNVTCTPCNDVRAKLDKADLFTKYAGGVASAKLLESIMINESSCGKKLESPKGAYGPMQLLPSTANQYREACGIVTKDANGNDVVPTITGDWLLSEANWEKSVCIASKFLQSLTGTCGSDIRNIAAGYNGGSEACLPSVDCVGMDSCGGGTMRRWECVWENKEHTLCNYDRAKGSYAETRKYAPKVAACVEVLP